ncbi:MAG: hypothetical protein D3926_07695 [Desulfobacteraceae bacterium]|nr:MAG: hypothetical protein D3926_07695 [Desulfobacteraceae bacterium]
MTVKILIKRQFKDGALKDAHEMLTQARINAMGFKGYISSETLSGCDNPNKVNVLSLWQNKEAWDLYAKSDVRKENENKYANVLENPTEYETFILGMQM